MVDSQHDTRVEDGMTVVLAGVAVLLVCEWAWIEWNARRRRPKTVDEFIAGLRPRIEAIRARREGRAR